MEKIKSIFNKLTSNKKRVIAFLFLFVFVVGLFLTIRGSFSENDHTDYIYIYSDNTNYEGNDPGAWILFKSAYLLNKGKLRIKYGINSNTLLSEKDKDVLLVLDDSATSADNSCDGAGGLVSEANNYYFKPLARDYEFDSCLSEKIFNATTHLLVEETELDNKVGVITYNDNYVVRTGLTNDNEVIGTVLENLDRTGYTDYLKALEGIEAFLENYEHVNNRELKVVLYISNVSKSNNDVEKAKYNEIKERYPFVKIIAIHNIVDNDIILNKIKNISDAQYLISYGGGGGEAAVRDLKPGMHYNLMDLSVNPVDIDSLFNQLLYSKEYSQFKIIDTINNEYFNFETFNIIENNAGIIDYDNNVLTWTLDRKMLTGSFVYLEVELGVNKNIILTDNMVPVSNATRIKSILDGVPDENIDTNLTPYVKFINKVVYDTSELPEECNTEPIPFELHEIGENINTNLVVPKCDGYKFVKWKFDTRKYRYYNDYGDLEYNNNGNYFDLGLSNKAIPVSKENYINGNINSLNMINGIFTMPGYDVYLIPVFDKTTVYKEVETTLVAELDTGSAVHYKMQNLAGCNIAWNVTTCDAPKGIRRATELTEEFTTSNIASNNSYFPVYVWYNTNDKMYYYYSVAPKIYLNNNSSGIFGNFGSFEDISGVQYWDSSKVTNLANAFSNTKITNLDALSNWDVSLVENMNSTFSSCKNLTDISGISTWQTRNLNSISHLFYSDSSLANLNGLSDWDTSKVTNMYGTFYSLTSLTDLTPIANWNTGEVTDMSHTFYYCKKVQSLTPISGWNTSKVEDMSDMFAGMISINDISPISGWNVSKVKNMSGMFSAVSDGPSPYDLSFYSMSVTTFEPLNNWVTSSLENMSGMFSHNSKIETVGLTNWDTSKVTNMSKLFLVCDKLTDISGLSNWNTSKVTNMSEMFTSCSRLVNIDALTNWNTSVLNNMSQIFFNTKIDNLTPLTNWDVSRITDFSDFFFNTDIMDLTPISGWNVSNATTMKSMFESTKISDLTPIANWDVTKVANYKMMFRKCTNIVNASSINNWNINSSATYTNMFQNVTTHPEFTKVIGTWDDQGTFTPGGN